MTTTKRQRTYTERDGIIYCDRANCPGSTGLRCYRTGVPICPKCSKRTEMGYLSVDAAKEQADKFFNIETTDYVLAGIIAFMMALGIGFFVVSILRFFIFAIFAGVFAGGAVSEAVQRTIKFKRGRYTGRVVGAGIIIATGVLLMFNPLSAAIYGVIATTTAVSRFEIGLRV